MLFIIDLLLGFLVVQMVKNLPAMQKTQVPCGAELARSVLSNSLQPHGLQPTRLLSSMGFFRQEYWSGLPFPPEGGLPDAGTERSPALAGIFFTIWTTRKPNNKSIINNITLGSTYKYINLCFRMVVVVICSMQHLTKLHIWCTPKYVVKSICLLLFPFPWQLCHGHVV